MYARIEGDQIAEYPLTEHEIKERFPSTSFTTNFSACLPDGYVCVRPGSPPFEDDMKITTESTPAFDGEIWHQTWVQSDRYTAEQLAEMDAQKQAAKWIDMRADRNERLSSCSWIIERHRDQKDAGYTTSISDAEYQLWLEYRQNLRDFPATVTDIDNLDWPKAPDELQITVL